MGIHGDGFVCPFEGGGVRHVVRGQRAHPAQVLGEDQPGIQPGQGVGVQRVQITAGGELLLHVRVDLARGHVPGVPAADHDGLVPPGRGGFVALEGDADQIVAQAQVADDFPYLAKTPANAAKQALEKIGKGPEDVDLWEINEAFASVALNSMRMLGVDEDKVNVNGGAIALGHPVGSTGARLLTIALHELERRGAGTALVTMCAGGAMATATIIERL